MNENVESISKRLSDQADEKLRLEIRNAFEPVQHLFRDGYLHNLQFNPHHVELKGCQQHEPPEGSTTLIRHDRALKALIELAFIVNCDNRRQSAIDAFMARVKELGAEIDELREQIPS